MPEEKIETLMEMKLRGDRLTAAQTRRLETFSRRALDVREVMRAESSRYGEGAESIDGRDDHNSVWDSPER